MTGAAGNMTTATGWALIEHLVSGRSVVQLGYGYGHDTARLALHAQYVTSLGQSPHLAHTGYLSAGDQWADVLEVRMVRGKVHSSCVPVEQIYYNFTPREFDVAIVDLTALQVSSLSVAVEAAAFLAPVVVVLQPSHWIIADSIAGLLGDHWACDAQGNLFVLRDEFELSVAAAAGE